MQDVYASTACHEVCCIVVSCRERSARGLRLRKPSQSRVGIAVVYAVATIGVGIRQQISQVVADCDSHIAVILAREGEAIDTCCVFEVEFVDRPCYVVFIASDGIPAIKTFIEDIGVGTSATYQRVRARSTVERVFPCAAFEDVVASSAVELIVVISAL